MNKTFTPDFRHVVDAARNRSSIRIPLYEHAISCQLMEDISGKSFLPLINGDAKEKREFFKNYSGFYQNMGYDTVSYEQSIAAEFPGGGALGGHVDPVIKNRADFEKYPWDELEAKFFEHIRPFMEALRDTMPLGMKAIGGPGNGIFECVQDLVGYTNLCYISIDDPDLYADLFRKIGDLLVKVWNHFLMEFGDIYCVLRFGDDLGYKTNTLLPEKDIRQHILPQYKRIVDLVHAHGKPFLLHSCGCIFSVMDDLIDKVGIDAKHSNEDQITPFSEWVERYGNRIGNFGGIDVDALCRLDPPSLTEYIEDILHLCDGHGGVALGTGNSVADYVPAEQYLHMVEVIRKYRGDL